MENISTTLEILGKKRWIQSFSTRNPELSKGQGNLIYLSGVYLEGNWVLGFEPRITTQLFFHSANRTRFFRRFHTAASSKTTEGTTLDPSSGTGTTELKTASEDEGQTTSKPDSPVIDTDIQTKDSDDGKEDSERSTLEESPEGYSSNERRKRETEDFYKCFSNHHFDEETYAAMMRKTGRILMGHLDSFPADVVKLEYAKQGLRMYVIIPYTDLEEVEAMLMEETIIREVIGLEYEPKIANFIFPKVKLTSLMDLKSALCRDFFCLLRRSFSPNARFYQSCQLRRFSIVCEEMKMKGATCERVAVLIDDILVQSFHHFLALHALKGSPPQLGLSLFCETVLKERLLVKSMWEPGVPGEDFVGAYPTMPVAEIAPGVQIEQNDFVEEKHLQSKPKLSNVLPFHGNPTTMNLNALILNNIQSSHYFKVDLYSKKTYHEVILEMYHHVKHLEPWEKGSRKTAGQTGMCGGVRGVGAGGIVSTAFCVLYKLYTLKLTRKQLNGLLNYEDAPHVRAMGFMYIRYTQPPADLWTWFEPYLEDEEEVEVRAGGGKPMTIGEIVRNLLTKLDWFSTLFPRIPVPITKDILAKLKEHDEALKEGEEQEKQAEAEVRERQRSRSAQKDESRSRNDDRYDRRDADRNRGRNGDCDWRSKDRESNRPRIDENGVIGTGAGVVIEGHAKKRNVFAVLVLEAGEGMQRMIVRKDRGVGHRISPIMALAFRVTRTLALRRLCTSAVVKADYDLNDPFEHATGREKLVLQAEKEGNPDPFNTKGYIRGKGTKSDPTSIPSFLKRRDAESMHINYIWLEKGVDRRCSCGFWFRLVDAKPLPNCPEFKAIPN
ncbi:unnamed protein product [Notodromas monacha]|uniref:Serpin domain-containing protein n=1 Tax=Notodromas monacha TaxID=399045 RepID=A0A7R9BK25_9CRUS|nr:unnamed protein product [Notodromas monacha]CAG0915818.1 unnamed protein product [Notodromas monacha]